MKEKESCNAFEEIDGNFDQIKVLKVASGLLTVEMKMLLDGKCEKDP